MNIDLYYTQSSCWHAVVDGACGSGATPWAALAEALEVWERRGKPPAPSSGRPRGGPGWVVERASVDHRDYYRYRVEGTNLYVRPGAFGRRFSWSVPDLNADQYEILCDVIEVTTKKETANV